MSTHPQSKILSPVARPGKKQRVAVGIRFQHVFRGDIVTGAGTILDDTLLADAFRQPLRDEPRDDIDSAARGKAGDDSDRTCWIVVCRSDKT